MGSSSLKIRYQGNKGAYSHLAAIGFKETILERIKEGTQKEDLSASERGKRPRSRRRARRQANTNPRGSLELSPKATWTFESLFNSVNNSDDTLGILPLWNTSSQVPVFKAYSPLLKNLDDIEVIARWRQPVIHCLIGLKGAKIEDIAEAWTHEQAYLQADAVLKERGISFVDKNDTARGIDEIIERDAKYAAAIASAKAAGIRKDQVEILLDNINNLPGNTTEFMVFRKRGITFRRHFEDSLQRGRSFTYGTLNTGHIDANMVKDLEDALVNYSSNSNGNNGNVSTGNKFYHDRDVTLHYLSESVIYFEANKGGIRRIERFISNNPAVRMDNKWNVPILSGWNLLEYKKYSGAYRKQK